MVYVVIYIKIQVPSIVACKLEEVSPIFPIFSNSKAGINLFVLEV